VLVIVTQGARNAMASFLVENLSACRAEINLA